MFFLTELAFPLAFAARRRRGREMKEKGKIDIEIGCVDGPEIAGLELDGKNAIRIDDLHFLIVHCLKFIYPISTRLRTLSPD